MTAPAMDEPSRAVGLLGDTAQRDYAHKLRLFSRFAEPELRAAIKELELRPDMRILDAGCGSGETLEWLALEAGAGSLVVGIDLAAAHISAAHSTAVRATGPANITVLQADLRRPPFVPGSFDLIWAINTINHLRDPLAGLRELASLLRPGGRIAAGQSALLAEMYFAWDARLEQRTNEAVRRYYRDRYGLKEDDLAAVRSIVGLMREASLHDLSVNTRVIERLAPLRAADEAYLLEAIFRGTWGERLRPYLGSEDFEELSRLCDPGDRCYALKRTDFHFLQTLTLVVGQL